MIGACQNMLLFGVSTISVALLTYLLVLPLLFRCDGLAQEISGWLNGKAAAATTVVAVALGTASRMAATMSGREVVPC